MIDYLNVARAAYFYKRKRRLSDVAITRLFRDLREGAVKPSNNLFRVVRVEDGDLTTSAICFSYDRAPSFLSFPDGVAREVERIWGFLMLIEKGDFIAVVRAGLDLTAAFKNGYLERVGHEKVDSAIARHDAVFQKLRLRNMSTSKFTLRSKSLEAGDLENAVATSSASRFVTQGYSVVGLDGSYSATPSTGRISARSDRAGHAEISAWAGEIIDRLAAGCGAIAPFIRNFARPIDLAAIPAGITMTAVAVDVMALSDRLHRTDNPIRLVQDVGGVATALTQAQLDPLLADLDRVLPLRRVRRETRIIDPTSGATLGQVRMAKTRISVVGFDTAAITGIWVESQGQPLGQDPDRRLLAKYIDREDLFTILFSDLALAYIDGALYRDEGLRDGGAAFLRHLRAEPALAQVTSEKGGFAVGQTAFDITSVFRVVVDTIAQGDDILLCDDLGDEWADFIGISSQTTPTMISFYHAKHGEVSLSASAFHDAVGQAQKNLGRMTLPAEAMLAKYGSWDNMYRNGGVDTAITRRMRGGHKAQIEAEIETVRQAPDVFKRAYIVTSSLSLADVTAVLQGIGAGNAPSPHFVQLYWLLMSYFSACSEVGVSGYIVCRP